MKDYAPLLEVKDVWAGYEKDSDILHGVNLRILPGELVAIIGPNGAGKSTLAKTICGLLTPHRGKITFKGENIAGLKSNQIVQRGICYVPQISNVFSCLTVEENLEMGPAIRKICLSHLKDKVYAVLPALANRRCQRASTLSRGEHQMLALGKALMLEPELLLLDEPCAALSPMPVCNICEQIQQINQGKTAIVLVEQNARKALAMVHRGYVLDTGRDRLSGSGSELLNDPQVEQMCLGTSNLGDSRE